MHSDYVEECGAWRPRRLEAGARRVQGHPAPPSLLPHSRCPGKGHRSSTEALHRPDSKQRRPLLLTELLQSLGQLVKPAPASACVTAGLLLARTHAIAVLGLRSVVLHLQGQLLKSDRPVRIMALKVVERAEKLIGLDALRRGCVSESLQSGQISQWGGNQRMNVQF